MMKHSKLKLGAAISTAVAAMAIGSVAQAAEVTIGGQVNRMIRYADDDVQSDTQFLDNGASQSRLNFAVSSEFAGWNVEAFTELRFDSNNSAFEGIDPNEQAPGSDGGVETAYLDLRFSSEWGKISMGRGDGAARFAQRQDLSGTELADNFDNRRIAAIDWTDGVGSIGVSLGDVFQNYEGTRDDRIRYDAPSLGGFTLSGSAGSGRSWEAGLTYDSADENAYFSYGDGLRIIGAIGYTSKIDVDTAGALFGAEVDDQIAASVSALLPGGLNLTVGYGDKSYIDDTGLEDNDAFYIKPGWRFGNHAVSVSYWSSSDIADTGAGNSVDGEQIALAYQWTGGEGVDVYASAGQQSADGNGTVSDPEDSMFFLAGARVSF